jgi:hypothetical protein
MRTRHQMDLDAENGILGYTHEEWHMYNEIGKCADYGKGCDISKIPEEVRE